MNASIPNFLTLGTSSFGTNLITPLFTLNKLSGVIVIRLPLSLTYSGKETKSLMEYNNVSIALDAPLVNVSLTLTGKGLVAR